MHKIDGYLSAVMDAILHIDHKIVADIVKAIEQAQMESAEIIIAGNGGSATTASHFAGDLEKTCHIKSRCLNDSPYLLTAYSNDVSYKDVFAEQILELAEAKDVFIGISTSGQSKNIIQAAWQAKRNGLLVIGLTGNNNQGGDFYQHCDICLIILSNETRIVEDVHLAVCHCIIDQLR